MYRKLFSILALFVVLLTSCQLHEPVESAPAPAAKEGDCIPEYRWFNLDFWRTGLRSFTVDLQTGPFIVKPCMCKVVQYELYVSTASASQWNLALSQGQAVPFSPSSIPSHDILTITDIGPIFENVGDQGNGLLKAVAVDSVPVHTAELYNAGGLCIIENYDGNGVTYPVGSGANGPIIVFHPTQIPGVYLVKVYIPEEITDPL